MPFYDEESDLGVDTRMFNLNRAYANGTVRERMTPDMVKNYGARLRATLRPSAIVGKDRIRDAFMFEAPARDTRLGAFKEVGMIRGRAKSAYNLVTGKSIKGVKRMVLTAPESGYPAGGMASYVTVPEGAATIGQVTVPAEDLWKRDLEDFSKDIRGMHMFTTNSQEIRYYQKGKLLVDNGKKIFANNPQMLAAIAPIEGELARWRSDRAWALTQQQGTSNQFSISKIQTRMINALNYARTAMGIAAIPAGSILPEAKVPTGQLPNVPGAPGTPEPPAPAPPIAPTTAEKALAPSWFDRNKTLVIGGTIIALLVGGFVWYKSQR